MPHSVYCGLVWMFKANKASNCTNVFKGCSTSLLTLLWHFVLGDLKNVNCCHCAHLKEHWKWFQCLELGNFSSLCNPVSVSWGQDKFWNPCAPFVQIFGNLLKICHKNKIKLRTLGFVRKTSRAIVISPGSHMELNRLCAMLLLGWAKSLYDFFHKIKDTFFIFTNNVIDLDLLSMLAISCMV